MYKTEAVVGTVIALSLIAVVYGLAKTGDNYDDDPDPVKVKVAAEQQLAVFSQQTGLTPISCASQPNYDTLDGRVACTSKKETGELVPVACEWYERNTGCSLIVPNVKR